MTKESIGLYFAVPVGRHRPNVWCKMRKYWWIVVVVLLLALPAPARAGDDIEAINSTWRDFVAAVRRGDYPSAHRLFSEQSQAVFPYAAFSGEYGPLSAARETVLADPSRLSTSRSGDWAEVRFSVVLPVSGRVVEVAAPFVKNNETWSLVAARNETRERFEAAARDFLRRLAPHLSGADAEEMVNAVIVRELANNQLGKAYVFAVKDRRLRAMPNVGGLRAFHVDNWGQVKQGIGDAATSLGQLAPLPNAALSPAAPPKSARLKPVPEFTGIPAPLLAAPTGDNDAFLPELADPFANHEAAGAGAFPEPGYGLGEEGLPPPDLSNPFSPAEGERPANIPEPGYLSLPDNIF